MRYSTEATYRPPIVEIQISNNTGAISSSGTAHISITNQAMTGLGGYAYRSKAIYIPPIKPGEYLTIPVYLDYREYGF